MYVKPYNLCNSLIYIYFGYTSKHNDKTRVAMQSEQENNIAVNITMRSKAQKVNKDIYI